MLSKTKIENVNKISTSHKQQESIRMTVLNDLIYDDEIISSRGNLINQVLSLCLDSRKVVPGSLFFAIEGQNTNGAFYVEEAIDRGAIAVITDSPIPLHCPVPFIQVSNVRELLSKVSSRFYYHPDRNLRLTGITGTNGKTTVSMLTKHLFNCEVSTNKTAVLGTVHYDLGGRVIPSMRTTPEAHDICLMLHSAVLAGCTRAIMEVSSHGVCQKRVHNLNFETAVFLNLTPEHLDFHTGMEEYFSAKREFVIGKSTTRPKQVIINLDDDYGKRLFNEIPDDVKKIGIGEDKDAHFRARHIHYTSTYTEFELEYPGGVIEIISPMIGRFNVQNVLASIAIGWVEGFELSKMVSQLRKFKGSPGRLESVAEGQKFNVFVDYAHTSDALRNVLSVLREVTDGRLLLVFGCGGDRDQQKRPAMTSAAQEFCDYVWATADNPRSEPLDSIFNHMKNGVCVPEHIQFIKDRRRAIGLAIEHARPNDCLVIAGKGHESYQEINNTIVAFDDRTVTRELLKIKRTSLRGGFIDGDI
jgi:UDP-N-acetylmuramoyl-L-alanyl-D-glutamate--2,6-diaminopimelate ligase